MKKKCVIAWILAAVLGVSAAAPAPAFGAEVFESIDESLQGELFDSGQWEEYTEESLYFDSGESADQAEWEDPFQEEQTEETLHETEAETEGAELAFMYGWDGSGSEGDDLYFNASVDGKVYTFVVESNLCDENSEVYQTVKNLKVGDQIDMEGFLYWYEGAQPHIINVMLPEEEE